MLSATTWRQSSGFQEASPDGISWWPTFVLRLLAFRVHQVEEVNWLQVN